MQQFLDVFNGALATINGILWGPIILYVLLTVGILFTVWSRFSQLRVLTHGVAVVRGKFSDGGDPGAISHFQALSAALSATVGLGNIGGVALAIALGGPGAVFWMWMVGLLGMALKTTEVTLSMLYRNTDDPADPHGGPMWVVSRALAEVSPRWAGLGRWLGGAFCVTLLVSTITGGNFFQAWNVGNVTQQYFGVPSWSAGLVLAVLVGLVILGGIHRIGAVAGRLVPLMCGIYLAAGLAVIAVCYEQIPEVFALIFRGAFSELGSQGAFLGGTAGFAFSTGLQRAFFSNEAGQGSSPIAHCAARTREPAREGLVAGLEPFVDTLVVCTLTALVILLSGAWNRTPELAFAETPRVVAADGGGWTLDGGSLTPRPDRPFRIGDLVEARLRDGESLLRLTGTVAAETVGTNGHGPEIRWASVTSADRPRVEGDGVYLGYNGAAFTAHAFDRVWPGLGKWLVTAATWLFALSTLISWSYYGEQGIVFLVGERWVQAYRVVFCGVIVVACLGVVRSITELNNLTLLGTGVMLWANVPITLLFAGRAMAALRDYRERMSRAVEAR